MAQKPSDGLGTQLRRLLELLDGDLETIYAEDDPNYRPRYTPVMKALADGAALTVKDIAATSSISHSAASQTVSRMVAEGFLKLSVGLDHRERRIRLTARAHALLPRLKARWAAADSAARALGAEIGVPLGHALRAAIEALEKRSFAKRIEEASRSGRTRKRA